MNKLTDLPNQKGFEFIGVKKTGEKIECHIDLHPIGMYGVYDASNQPCWFQLAGWLRKSSDDVV